MLWHKHIWKVTINWTGSSSSFFFVKLIENVQYLEFLSDLTCTMNTILTISETRHRLQLKTEFQFKCQFGRSHLRLFIGWILTRGKYLSTLRLCTLYKMKTNVQQTLYSFGCTLTHESKCKTRRERDREREKNERVECQQLL